MYLGVDKMELPNVYKASVTGLTVRCTRTPKLCTAAGELLRYHNSNYKSECPEWVGSEPLTFG